MRYCAVLCTMALCAGVSFPENPRGVEALARLSAAHAAPCSTAISLYESLCADTTVPDSIRAAAFGFRADYAFAQREYETARDYYRKALALDGTNTRYDYRSGLSLLANGDTAEAAKVFAGISGKSETDLSNEARVMLGRLAYARDDFAAAMEWYRQTGAFITTKRWSISALFGKLQCARALGLADSAALYEKQLSPYAKTLLEKEAFAKIRGKPVVAKSDNASASGKLPAIDTGHKSASAAPVDSTPFALQVGAFASEASALAMKKKLAATLEEVRCVTAVVSARVFYRVWVGNFATREEAEKFGQDELMQLGLVFRVVAK